jgi:nucleoside-diphosphate-sugar epimerase
LHELNPINNYEKSKLASEKIILETTSIKKIEFVILRPSNIFGNGMPNSSLFQLINAIHNRTFFYIGNKLGKMNYIHIENVVNALLLCGFHPNAKNQIFNLSDNCSIEKFIESLSKELGKINFYPTIPSALINFLVKLLKFLPGLPLTKSRIDALRVKAIYSNEKIERMLGYTSKVDIQSGLSRLVISWRNKFDVQAGYK